MAQLRNVFGGLALDETLKSFIDKFRNPQEPLFISNADGNPLVVESRVRPDPAIVTSIRSVTASATAGVIVPVNINRSALSIYNASTASVLYILISASPPTVTSTLCTAVLGIGDYWELPQGVNGCYKGAIQGIWATASGTCVVTEYS